MGPGRSAGGCGAERACETYGKRVLAVSWVLDQPPLSIALWGARHPTQLDEVADVMGWKLGLKSTALSSIASAIREPESETETTLCEGAIERICFS